MKKYNNRLICFLDVLGYSQMIENHGIEYVYERYSKFIDEAKTKAFYGKSIHEDQEKEIFMVSDIVSDSMLFVSNDISDAFSVNNFIGAIHNILELGLEHNFLFRGAITVGDIIYDQERSIFLSKEFNSLAKFEPKMEIPICVIFDEAKDIVTESLYGVSTMKNGIIPSGDLPVIKYDIPLKKDPKNNIESKDMWCLNYTFFASNETLQKVKDFLIEDKKTNFIKYLEYIKQVPYQLVELDNKFLPIKYLQIMKSRSGMRIAFLNKNMSIYRTSDHFPFPSTFIALPDNIEISYDPNTQDFSYRAIGKWKEK